MALTSVCHNKRKEVHMSYCDFGNGSRPRMNMEQRIQALRKANSNQIRMKLSKRLFRVQKKLVQGKQYTHTSMMILVYLIQKNSSLCSSISSSGGKK